MTLEKDPLINIDQERCKGCELCISVCPRDILEASEKPNENGHHPVNVKPELQKEDYTEDCKGCASCALMCPEVAITIENSHYQNINK